MTPSKSFARLLVLVQAVAHMAAAQPSPPVPTTSAPSPYRLEFQEIPPGKDRIEPVTAGAPSPFSGQLFDPSTALRWANYLQQCKTRLITDVEAERRISEIKVGFWMDQHAKDREYFLRQSQDQYQQILKLQQPTVSPWYLSPWTGFVAGMVITGTLVGMGAYLKK